MKWTEERYQRLLELKEQGFTHREIIEIFKHEYDVELTLDTISSKLYNERKRRKNVKRDKQHKQKVTTNKKGITESSTVIAMQEGADKDERYILKAHGFDPERFELLSVTNNFWQQNNTQDGLVNLYQSKIKVKPTAKINFDVYLKEIESVRVKRKRSGLRNLVIPLADMHFPINTTETLEDYIRDVREVIENGYDTIVVELLGDMFHSNAMRKTQTIKGTELETVDMEFAIEEARRFFHKLLIICIQNANNVRIEFAAGNHSDFDYMFLLYLEARYEQLEVNRHNKPRIAYQLGNVGIMLTHGHFGKKSDYPILFATEFKDVWASSTWLEVHQGHKHTMEAQNVQGVIHRQLGVLKANDIYEQDNGYTMNYKSTQAFEYDNDKLRVVYELG